MSDQDPLDQLHHFDPGVPMSPLPASEVRRRGDRRRRRTTALTVAASALAVAVVATPVAVLAHGSSSGTAPLAPVAPSTTAVTDPAPQSLTDAALLTAGQLPVRTRLTPWQQEAPDGKPTLLCQPAGADLGAGLILTRTFGASVAPTPDLPQGGEDVASRIRLSVLQLPDEQAATASYARATSWIETCDHPVGMDPSRMSQEGAPHMLDVDATAEWVTWTYPADDLCDGCDAARYDRMGIAQVGDRLVLTSLAEVGGPLEPDGLDTSMDALMTAAVDAAS